MTNLSVIGRSFGGLYSLNQPLRYIGCVSTNPDKSNRADDLVQSLPVNSPSEAIAIGHELRGLLLEQGFTQPPCCERLPASMVLS